MKELRKQGFKVLALVNSVLAADLAEDFARRIWPDETFVDCKNAISVHVHHIRRKLNDTQKPYRFIKTSWGAGYILE